MPYILSVSGIVLGFTGVVLLAFSGNNKGHVSEDGNTVVITDGDYYSGQEKEKEIRNADWRNKNLTPLGWGLIGLGTVLQLAALVYAQANP